MKRFYLFALLAAVLAAAIPVSAQVNLGTITGGEKGALAVPDFRGSGEAQPLMGTFNSVLWTTLNESGIFRMVPKTSYPLAVPQRPQDFNAAPATGAARPAVGLALQDWSGPPPNANYLAFGYAAVQDGRLVLFGNFYNVGQPDLANAQVFAKPYFGTVDEAGARKVALEFASDILKQFGQEGITNTRIYFVSDRTGSKEIWSMNWDGTDQRAVTSYRSITSMPAVSKDGTKLGYTTWARGLPMLEVYSAETKRRLPFYNQKASMNATIDFHPNGQEVVFASTLAGDFAQLYAANINGSNLRRLTSSRAIDVEPKVNPRTGAELVFVSGRSGPQQIYKMNIDGADIVRLTTGEGEAANPAWHPNGQLIAFAWTRGYEPGTFNIFVMDVASRELVQLTHGGGRNENPSWSPDGRRIVFSSRRGRSTQLFTMLADGTQVRQLTTQGNNEKPVWSRGSF